MLGASGRSDPNSQVLGRLVDVLVDLLLLAPTNARQSRVTDQEEEQQPTNGMK